MYYPYNCCTYPDHVDSFPFMGGNFVCLEDTQQTLIRQRCLPNQSEFYFEDLSMQKCHQTISKPRNRGIAPLIIPNLSPSFHESSSRDRKVLSSKIKSCPESPDEYSPGQSNDSADIDKDLRNDIINDLIELNEMDENNFKLVPISRKNKYSDSLMKPDGSLPPVIKRRNQNRRKQIAASMTEVPQMNQSWGIQPAGIGASGKGRSQSISNEQWNQMIEMRSANPAAGGINSNVSNTDFIPPHHPGFVPTVGHGRNMGIAGRGMVSSASVCDLNTLSQQQQRSYPRMPSANSFQQLSLMNYDGGNMMWVPSCALCQPPNMYPPSMGPGGMKRTTSNISMNMSSVGSDITGYPWANNPHVHHMPPMYPPGYYPGGCHQHMMPQMAMQGSAMSIPDSTRSFSRMPPSPAPSIRSNSHRSHKSSKARSYCGGDPGDRKSRNRSRRRSDSDDSGSSSLSENELVQIPISRPAGKSGLAWQCDHCTFINPGHALTCGMCSKTLTKNNESHSRRGSDRRKNGSRRKTDQEENISDYDNDKRTRKRNGRESRNEHRPKGSGSLKGSAKPPRNKSRQKDSISRSPSLSGSNEDEGSKLERQLKDLRISSRSRTGDYDRLSMTSRAKESGSLKREGKRGSRRRD